MAYAENTKVSSERSRAEIEKILTRYGADSFLYGWEADQAIIGFRVNERMIKFFMPLPNRNSDEFTHTNHKRPQLRSADSQEKAWEQAVKQRWRALSLIIKAKLEAVESGITTFDDEFMAHIILPNGDTVGKFMVPQIEAAYESGLMPSMLPQLTSGN